jgi:hypothetical protein
MRSIIKELLSSTGYIINGILIIAGLFGAFYGLPKFIDSRVEQYVHTDEFLKKLSDNVRPSCIFDQKGAIIVDMGAMSHIENIEVSPTPKNEFPGRIIVHPNRYFSHAPLLSTIDPFIMNVSVERGTKFDLGLFGLLKGN